MLGARSSKSTTEAGPHPVDELPAGFDDEASPFFVPVELREDYPAARPTLDALHATERALARQLAENEATAAQEPVVRAAIEQAQRVGVPGRRRCGPRAADDALVELRHYGERPVCPMFPLPPGPPIPLHSHPPLVGP